MPTNTHTAACGLWRYMHDIRCPMTRRNAGEVLRTTKTGNATGAKFRSTSTLKAPIVSTELRHATRGTSTPYISRRLVFSHGQILGPGGGHTGSWQSERIYIELVSYDVLHNSQRVLPPGCRLLGRVMRPWHPQFTHVAPDRSANVQWMLYELPMLFSKFRLRVGLQVEITNASSSSDKSFQS